MTKKTLTAPPELGSCGSACPSQPPRDLVKSLRGRVAYVDTVAFLMKRRPHWSIFRRIRELIRFGQIGSKTCRPTKKGGFTKLTVHQPGPAALQQLHEWAEQLGWVMNEVHIALDLLTEDRRSAFQWKWWFDRHILPRWRSRKQRV